MNNSYKQLSNDLLYSFYLQIKQCIDYNILSAAMIIELKLIEAAAFERGIFILDKNKGEMYDKQQIPETIIRGCDEVASIDSLLK